MLSFASFNKLWDCKEAMARVLSCFSSFSCIWRFRRSSLRFFSSFCSFSTTVQRLGAAWLVGCTGKDGERTNASIGDTSSSHSEMYTHLHCVVIVTLSRTPISQFTKDFSYPPCISKCGCASEFCADTIKHFCVTVMSELN